jgi:hypothetical protein
MQVIPSPGGRPARSRVRRAVRTLAPSAAAVAVTTVALAAFTDTAGNAGSTANAASVEVSEDVAASAPLFDLADWQPGEDDTVARCIGVTNRGSIALPLSFRLDGAPSGRLGDFVDVRVERGTRPASSDSADCAGFDADGVVVESELDDLPTTAAGALPDRGPRLAPGAERAYRITWHLQDTEAAEGLAVSGVAFLWETTSAG